MRPLSSAATFAHHCPSLQGSRGSRLDPAPGGHLLSLSTRVLPDAGSKLRHFQISAHQGLLGFLWMPPQPRVPGSPRSLCLGANAQKTPPKWIDRCLGLWVSRSPDGGHLSCPCHSLLPVCPLSFTKHNSNHRPPVPAAPELRWSGLTQGSAAPIKQGLPDWVLWVVLLALRPHPVPRARSLEWYGCGVPLLTIALSYCPRTSCLLTWWRPIWKLPDFLTRRRRQPGGLSKPQASHGRALASHGASMCSPQLWPQTVGSGTSCVWLP